MTPQIVNVGNVCGEPTVTKHFGYIGADGTQTDFAVVAHEGSNSRLYQIRGGKYTDMTGRLLDGQDVFTTYDACLAKVRTKTDQVEVFVG